MQLYTLDSPEAGGGAGSGEEAGGSSVRGRIRPLPVTGDVGQCTVKVCGSSLRLGDCGVGVHMSECLGRVQVRVGLRA